MVTAELISPSKIKDWRKRGFLNSNEGIFCESCNLDYKDEEYKILFVHKKIAYFFFADPDNDRLYTLCHDCLFKKIKKIAEGEELELLIMDDDHEYSCKFYPHETWDEDDDDNFPDFDIGFGK